MNYMILGFKFRFWNTIAEFAVSKMKKIIDKQQKHLEDL